MKIHWLIPITVDRALQFTSKNELARAVVAAGHEMTTTVAYVETPTVMDAFSDIEYCHTPPGRYWPKLKFHWRMLSSVWRRKSDAVMFGFQAAHLLPFAWMARFFLRNKPRFVMDIRTVPVDVKDTMAGKMEYWRYSLSLRLARKFCDGMTVITPMLGETVKPYVGRHRDDMAVWTSGVDLQHFPRGGQDCRSKYKLEGKTVLFYHGVLSPNRGLQNALRAFARLADASPELVFMFVGDGEGREELQQLAAELDLGDRVIFTGKVPYAEVPRHVRCADIAILPFPDIYWWKVSSPIKLMEYLALGIPVVATDIDAHRWVVETTGGAVLAGSDDPGALERALLEGLAGPMEKADLETLEATISWNRQARSLIDYLQRKCIRSRRGQA